MKEPIDIKGAMNGSRLVTLPHLRPEVERALSFVDTPKVWLEIGFDHGFRLRSMSALNPSVHFVGLEVRKKRVEELLLWVKEMGVENLLPWRIDARTAIHNVFKPASFDGVDILFPTPWWDPKKREKRLLVQPEFLAAIHRCLKPKGVVYLETDVREYSERVDSAFNQTSHLWTPIPDGSSKKRPRCERRSRRQRKCAREALRVFEFCFEKVS